MIVVVIEITPTMFQALEKCQLGDLVRAKDEKLDSPGMDTQFMSVCVRARVWK